MKFRVWALAFSLFVVLGSVTQVAAWVSTRMRKRSSSAVITPQTIYLVSGSSWVVPSNWNSAYNTIEAIGGGGGGGSGAGGGGGGGGYSKVYNVALTPGSTVSYSIGSGGSGGIDGGSPPTSGSDTYFCNSSSNCANVSGTAVVVGAKGGSAGGNNGPYTGGAGGAGASGVGAMKFSGGTGGATANNRGGGGGGGSAGPNGDGATGGSAASSVYGAGGGGASGGTAGGAPTGSSGGVGGAGFSGTAGGVAGTSSITPGAGTNGSGGGGGYDATSRRNGGVGGNGTEWDASHGAGGGGGGGSRVTASGAQGGLYGAGGGGYNNGGASAGAGAQGIVVIKYGPSAPVVTTPTTITNCGYGGLTLSNGDRTITDSNVNSSAYSNHSMNSGKWYFEAVLTNYTQSFMGLTCAGSTAKCTYRPAYIAPFAGVSITGSTLDSTDGVTSGTYSTSYTSGDVAQFAVDFAAGKMWVGAKGAWFGGGNPATGANPFSTFTPGSACWIGMDFTNNSATASAVTLSVGQSQMLYGPPSGFSSGWGAP